MSPYEVLGVKKNASAKTINKAYRKLAMAAHPDRNPGDESAAARASEINAVLYDPARRKCYDETGQTKFQPVSSEIASVLVPLLFETLAAFTANSMVKMEEVDLIAAMKSTLQGGMTHCKAQIGKMKKAIDAFEKVSGRLSIEDGKQDILGEAVRSQAEQTRTQIQSAEEQLAKIKRAEDFLALYRYRRDVATFGGMRASHDMWMTLTAARV